MALKSLSLASASLRPVMATSKIQVQCPLLLVCWKRCMGRIWVSVMSLEHVNALNTVTYVPLLLQYLQAGTDIIRESAKACCLNGTGLLQHPRTRFQLSQIVSALISLNKIPAKSEPGSCAQVSRARTVLCAAEGKEAGARAVDRRF